MKMIAEEKRFEEAGRYSILSAQLIAEQARRYRACNSTCFELLCRTEVSHFEIIQVFRKLVTVTSRHFGARFCGIWDIVHHLATILQTLLDLRLDAQLRSREKKDTAITAPIIC